MPDVKGPEFLAAVNASAGSELHPSLGSPLDSGHVLAASRDQEDAGFDGILVTETSTSAQAFVVGGQLLAATRRLRVVIAARPGVSTPISVHRALATLDAFHPGRLAVYLPPVDDDAEYQREGDRLTRLERQARRREFLEVLGRLEAGEGPLHHSGRFYQLAGAWTPMRPTHHVPVYLSGLSTAADEVAARSADVYLLPAEPPALVRARIRRVQELTNRPVRFGLRIRPIIGATAAQTHELAERVARSRRVNEGQPLRTATGALGDADELIGSPAHVCDTLLRYMQLGISVFQLHGYEPLADTERFAVLIAEARRRLTTEEPEPLSLPRPA